MMRADPGRAVFGRGGIRSVADGDDNANEEQRSMSELRRAVIVVFAIWGLHTSAASPRAGAQSWRLSLQGGEPGRAEIPLVAEVKDDVPAGFYFMEPAGGSESLTAHVFNDGEKRFLAVVLPRAAAARPTQYRLERKRVQDRDLTRGVFLRDQKGTLAVDFDEGILTMYHTKSGHKPFLFPLVGPDKVAYTRSYPMARAPSELKDQDHPHQRSFWFTHGNVNGIDFWGEAAQSGRIEEQARRTVVDGPALAQLTTKNDWTAPDGRTVCSDERVLTFYRTEDTRTIDFEVKILASHGPVTFGDTKEGTFGIRVASSMDVDKKTGGKITNAEGLTDESAWGQASAWVDYVGPIDNRTDGIAVLNHPSSFRFPTTWHVRTYGLFAANPFGWHDFGKGKQGDHTIPAGQSITFRYRIILHTGDTKAAAVPEQFAAYAHPPAVAIEKE
jgi:hypothetical protein